jgi:hypothetical protein
MIVATAQHLCNCRNSARSVPGSRRISEQRRPHQPADKNDVAATFRAHQTCQSADLPERDPMMRIPRNANGITETTDRKQKGRRRARRVATENGSTRSLQ